MNNMEKVYPNTGVGAIQMLSEHSNIDMAGAIASAVDENDHVWKVEVYDPMLPKLAYAIVYLVKDGRQMNRFTYCEHSTVDSSP